MEYKELKSVTKLESVTTLVKCDQCGKEHKGDTPSSWHEVATFHTSIHGGSDTYHVCSPECYFKLLKHLHSEMIDYSEPEIGGFDIKFVKRILDYLNL